MAFPREAGLSKVEFNEIVVRENYSRNRNYTHLEMI